ncbi:MAG: histidine kinase [Bacteroidales bacterium]
MREKRLRKKQEALRERIRFQFENLKSQINPHFLFNSFSTLVALIDQDRDIAIEYVEELSDMFRNVLEYKDLDVISLSEELAIIHNYYKIQKKRYGKNLELTISEIKRKDEIKIPPLSLQLLVENAIKHNVVSKDQPLQIRIFTDDKKGYLYVENVLQEKKETEHSTGIGIRNIIERYHLLTDRKIDVIKTETSFKIGLPYII